MKFSEVVAQSFTWLQREGRVSYRALRREHELDDDLLEDLKEALLFAHPQISEADSRGLVWTGGEGTGESKNDTIGAAETSPHHPAHAHNHDHRADCLRDWPPRRA